MMKKTLFLAASHLMFLMLGFALGVYLLPILTAPAAPTMAQINEHAADATYSGSFSRNLTDSDFLHWGEGEVKLSKTAISFSGKLAPGPDYKLYLSPTFVQTEAAFEAAKTNMMQVGDVKTFENFHVPIAGELDLTKFNTIVVWCESFGEFITAAKYR